MSEICKNNCQNPYNICYDNYLNTNACTECTGLICTPAKDNDEWESYRKILILSPNRRKAISLPINNYCIRQESCSNE